MKLLNFNKVLCLSPHPDDVEYSMFGTILKYSDTHFDILCLTQGGDCDSTTSSDRIQEVKNFWDNSNCKNYTLHFSNCKFLKDKNFDEWINYIETNFTGYNCIFTPSDKDSHFEHKIVCEMGYPLARVSKLSIIEYYSPSTLEYWIPNLYVDISNQYGEKLRILKQFKSQLHRTYFKDETILGFHTNFRCSKRGFEVVEQFNLKQVFI